MSEWGIADRTKVDAIIRVLMLKPKRFSEIWQYMKDSGIMTKRTLSIYLKNLEKENIIKRNVISVRNVQYSIHPKLLKDKQIGVVDFDLKDVQKLVNDFIKRVEETEDSDVVDSVRSVLSLFQRIRVNLFKKTLGVDKVRGRSVLLDWKVLDNLFMNLAHFEIQILTVYYEKYREETLKALESPLG